MNNGQKYTTNLVRHFHKQYIIIYALINVPEFSIHSHLKRDREMGGLQSWANTLSFYLLQPFTQFSQSLT
jgi:hypothetical protein